MELQGLISTPKIKLFCRENVSNGCSNSAIPGVQIRRINFPKKVGSNRRGLSVNAVLANVPKHLKEFHEPMLEEPETNPRSVVAIILGGCGDGAELYPLTQRRAKAAVPIGGSYRLIDAAMSNCINSGINKVYILTQFNSQPLNRHISRTYTSQSGASFGDGFVEVLAATQKAGESGNEWFHGVADAVRQFLWMFEDIKHNGNIENILILSGDHLYKMDYQEFLEKHIDSGADISVSCLPIDESRAMDLRLVKTDKTGQIMQFLMKPDEESLEYMRVETTINGSASEDATKSIINGLAVEDTTKSKVNGSAIEDVTKSTVNGSAIEDVTKSTVNGSAIEDVTKSTVSGSAAEDVTRSAVNGSAVNGSAAEDVTKSAVKGLATKDVTKSAVNGSTVEPQYLASMGIYLFKTDVLIRLLRGNFPAANDFESEVIPMSVKDYNVQAFLFNNYWEDIRTLKSFFDVNLALVNEPSKFGFFDQLKPIYSRPLILPPTKIDKCRVKDSIVSHGCILAECSVDHSIVGVRSVLEYGVEMKDTIMMGADYYETEAMRSACFSKRKVPLGIGKNTKIRKCIIDENARIGKDVIIANKDHVDEAERPNEGFYIRSGIVVVPRNSTINDGMII